MHEKTEKDLEPIKELLLEDYRYRAEAMKNSEQSGETRINIFLGIVTIAAAGLGTLLTSEYGPRDRDLYGLILGALSVLFLLGVVTLLRLLIRNKNTDSCKRDLDHIRQMFKDYFDGSAVLDGYYPLGPPGPDAKDRVSEKPSIWQVLKKDGERALGGLAHMMAIVNSLLFAGIASCAALLVTDLSRPVCVAIWSAVAAFLASGILQFIYIAHNEIKYKEKIRESMPTHAGGVVYWREDGLEGPVKYLLVETTKQQNKKWVFPKGKIKKGEGDLEAALREVLEESGVAARPVCPLGLVNYKVEVEEEANEKKEEKKDEEKKKETKETKKEHVRVKYYLMEKLFDSEPPKEKRLHRGFTFEGALKELQPEGRHLLRLAKQKIHSDLPGVKSEPAESEKDG